MSSTILRRWATPGLCFASALAGCSLRLHFVRTRHRRDLPGLEPFELTPLLYGRQLFFLSSKDVEHRGAEEGGNLPHLKYNTQQSMPVQCSPTRNLSSAGSPVGSRMKSVPASWERVSLEIPLTVLTSISQAVKVIAVEIELLSLRLARSLSLIPEST
jgi:hypothetical protein